MTLMSSQLRWPSPSLSGTVWPCPELPQPSLLLAKQERPGGEGVWLRASAGAEAHTLRPGLPHLSNVPRLPAPTLAQGTREPPGHMWLCLTR